MLGNHTKVSWLGGTKVMILALNQVSKKKKKSDMVMLQSSFFEHLVRNIIINASLAVKYG